MTISTPLIKRRRRGFTLVEVMIAATLASCVLAGVLSAFIFIARSGFRASSYSDLESETRRGLELFARDARNASDVRWASTQCLTLTVNGAVITYGYDASSTSSTYQSFYRQVGEPASAAPRTPLIHQLAANFSFQRYKLAQPGVTDNTAANDRETKLLSLTMCTARTSTATASASQTAVSTRYLLRNKRVAQ